MWQRFRAWAGQMLSRFVTSLGAVHDPDAARDPTGDKLAFTALAERHKLTDGRLPPAKFDPHTPRRTPAEERRQIEDRPVP